MSTEWVVAVSASVQLVAGVLSLRLIRTTKAHTAWSLIALGLIGMGLRRGISLYRFLSDGVSAVPLDLEFEVVGLVTSACMLGGVAGIRPIFCEIDRVKRRLQRSEERYRAVVTESIEGILFFDAEGGRVLEVNQAFCRLTGFTEEEVLGRTIYDLVDAPADRIGANIGRVLATGEQRVGERRYRRKDGTSVTVDVSAVLIRQGERPSICTVVHDLSERKKADEVREELVARLEGALARVKTLRGLLPICSSCKRIRDDKGYWNRIEAYIQQHSEAEFTHGLCPECAKALYPEFHKE